MTPASRIVSWRAWDEAGAASTGREAIRAASTVFARLRPSQRLPETRRTIHLPGGRTVAVVYAHEDRAAMKARKSAKKGRPRKEGARYPSGALKVNAAKKEAEMIAVVMNQPHRKTVPENVRRDPLAGFVLGRMRLSDEITRVQFEAGEAYLSALLAYSRMVGVPLPPSCALLAERVSGGGGGCGEEPDDDRVFRARRRFDDFEYALRDGLRPCDYNDAKRALMQVLLFDKHIGTMQLGALRSALNLIAKTMGMTPRVVG